MSTLPPEVHEAFSSAAMTTFQELLQTELISRNTSRNVESIISGPVVIATVQLLRDPPGSMSLVLPVDAAARLASRYLPAGVVLTPEIVDDVAGEFANVIAGQAKTMLKGNPFHFSLSVPMVVRADRDSSHPSTPTSNVTLMFRCDIGEFLLQASLVATNAPQEE